MILRWAPERFYWSLVDGGGYSRPGVLPLGLLSEAAEDIPGPSEDLHLVCAPARDGSGRIVVCGLAPEGTDRAECLSLTPVQVPAFLDGLVEPSCLELLVGRLEPAAIRRARDRRRWMGLASVVLSSAFVSVALNRWAASWTRAAKGADAAALSYAADVLPGGTPDGVLLELSRLRSAAAGAEDAPPDAAITLQSVLAHWPRRSSVETLGINVLPGAVLVAVATDASPNEFLSAFTAPEGWVLEEPRMHSSGPVTRVDLRLRREGGRP